MSYSLLHCHSQFSLLNGLDEPEKIVKFAASKNISAVALTDIASISGIPQFIKHSKKAGIKPILGTEIMVADHCGTVNLLALNKNGWNSLIRLISYLHTQRKYSNNKLSITEDELIKHIDGQNLLCVFGAPETILTNKFFKEDMRLGYNLDKDTIKANFVNPGWINDSVNLIDKYKSIFGRENVYVEACGLDKSRPICEMVLSGCRYIANKTQTKIVASTDSRYLEKQDAADFRALLCIDMETTYDGAANAIVRKNRYEYAPFFDSYNHYIPTHEALAEFNTPEEIAATNEIADRIETFDIIPKQTIPNFPAPNNLSQDEYLRQICREGWKSRNIPNDPQYIDRIKEELDVIQGAGLSSYFLIVADYVNAALNRGELCGPGRGSSGGCLISYLMGITHLDPIKWDLLFSRFYNAGRNTKDFVSMPDIDVDFPSNKRQNTFSYIKEKYGEDKVAQVITFIKIKGKGALKDILRISGKCSFDEMNRITENIPDEAAISDQLQIMKEEEGESKIIKWAIDNDPESFSEWVTIEENGSLSGPYAREFGQAVRLEGTRKAYGMHAAGLIISNTNLSDVCPVYLDKTGKNKILGFEFKELEELGFVKFDILATTVLDKMSGVIHLLNGGNFEDE